MDILLSDGFTLEKPKNVKGELVVTTWDQLKRTLNGDPAVSPPPGLVHYPDFQPISWTGMRSSGGTNLVFAFEVDEVSRQMITSENPLRLEVPVTTDENVEDFLPVVFDGEDYLPVGYGVSDSNVVKIVGLPRLQTSSKRGLNQTIRLFIYKKLGRYARLLGLRYARRHNGEYKYDRVMRDQFRRGDKVALLIHGFNSDTGWMLNTVAPFLHNEVLPYDHILVWDYETLATDIERTGEELATALKQQCGFGQDDEMTLHVYAHSMGSIVSRTMVELFGGCQFVDRLVVSGPPNQGTATATIDQGGVYLLTLLLNQYSVVPPVGVLNWDLKHLYEQSIGITDLAIGSEFLRKLNKTDAPSNVPYLVLAGKGTQFETERDRLDRIARKVLGTLPGDFLGDDHDLVVGLSSQRSVHDETHPNLTIKELPCNHFDYYGLPQARQFIKEWITK